MEPNVKLKVNLFIPGFGKSGTSSLHVYLGQHPQIFMSRIKEPHFFSRKLSFDFGFEHYNSLFDSQKEVKYFGESSTTYIGSGLALNRIKSYVETPKFIVLLRNPIERIYSHYTWLYSLGIEKLPLKEAVLNDMNSVFDADSDIDGNFKNYFFFSQYGSLLSAYINAFGLENIKVITTEKLNSNLLATMNECFSFLGVEAMESIKEVRQNITVTDEVDKTPMLMRKVLNYASKRIRGGTKLNKITHDIFTVKNKQLPLSDEDRLWLKEIVKKEVEKVKQITHQEFKEWAEFNS